MRFLTIHPLDHRLEHLRLLGISVQFMLEPIPHLQCCLVLGRQVGESLTAAWICDGIVGPVHEQQRQGKAWGILECKVDGPQHRSSPGSRHEEVIERIFYVFLDHLRVTADLLRVDTALQRKRRNDLPEQFCQEHFRLLLL